MTKEELEKEAEEYLKNLDECRTKGMMRNAYLAGAEPREKEIKSLGERCLQLQKDKGELIDKTRELERKIASIRGSHRVDLAKLNARIEQVERLKKENAELKSEKGCETCTKFDEVQLTKAKEIIKELLSSCFGYNSKTVNYEVKAKAEQFLKEVEE